MSQRKARIAVLGAGWWSQGWHLPHLSRHPEAEIVAIVEPNPHPRSAINELESTAALGERYGCPVFSSLADALASPLRLDGLLVCTSHASHFELGIAGLRAGLHVLMEKPMTTDPEEALGLAAAAAAAERDRGLAFLINNTANYRAQSRAAAALVRERRRVGRVQHVQCCMHSALLWLFDDPSNEGWTRSTGRMSGNGFGWGQLSHLLAFVFHVGGLCPTHAFAHTTLSERSGADLSVAAVITCSNGASIALSGSAAVPGNAHEAAGGQLGKYVSARFFGDEGMAVYEGYDQQPDSGRLQFSCLEAEDAHLYPNERSRGQAFNCIQPYSAVHTWVRSSSYTRGALHTRHNSVLPPSRWRIFPPRYHHTTHGSEPTLDSIPWRYGTRRLSRRAGGLDADDEAALASAASFAFENYDQAGADT